MTKYCYDYPMFAITADIIAHSDGNILLVERMNPPYGWCLPGGFVEIDETIMEGAIRELEEETNVIATPHTLQFKGFMDKVDRDPRQRTVTGVFELEMYPHDLDCIEAGDDAKDVLMFSYSEILGDNFNLVLDHKEIILRYFEG